MKERPLVVRVAESLLAWSPLFITIIVIGYLIGRV